MTDDTQMLEALKKLSINDGDVLTLRMDAFYAPEMLVNVFKHLQRAGKEIGGIITLAPGDSLEAIPSSDLFRLLEKRFVPEPTTDEELTGPRKDPYVSVNFMRDTETTGSWLVLFFPDETVVRLRMTEREANEFAIAVASGGGSMKVKV